MSNVKKIRNEGIKYTSFKPELFYYGRSTGSGWDTLNNENEEEGVTVSSCSWPSFNNYIVEYELCAENFEEENACIMIKFQLNNKGKLTYLTNTQDLNISKGSIYKKYYPVYYPASANNIYYNKMHVFIDSIFRGYSYEDALKSVSSWETHE